MTRDDAIKELVDELKKAVPENIDLSADDFDTLSETAESVLEDACGISTEQDEEDADEEDTDEPAEPR